MQLFLKADTFSYSRVRWVARMVKRYLHKRDIPVVLNLRNFNLSNVESELDDIPALESKFSERGLRPPVDLYELKELCALLRRQSSYHRKLQETLSQFESSSETCTIQKKKKSTELKPVDQLEGIELKKYYVLRQINEFERCFLRLRNQVVYLCFSFPNDLHAETPTGEADLVLQSNMCDETVGQDHIEVGHRLGVLKYSSSVSYYLLNKAANVEMALQKYLSDILTRELNFKPFLNPDTCHEFLLKGIYVDKFENEGLFLENDSHRLVGGASFASFCAYKAGLTAHKKFMPERFFTCARRYVLPPDQDTDKGLYSVIQRSNIQAMIATSTEKEAHSEYEKMLVWLISLYERLGVNFRVCNKRAASLYPGESLRTAVQLYSSHRKEYVDVAHISYSGDFVSQRISILNHDKDEQLSTTWLLDIAILSVPIVLANLLEKSADQLFVPECLLPYMYRTS